MMGHPVTLAFVGDIMLGRLVNEELGRNPPAHPFGDTLPCLQRADWLCANLECVLCPPTPAQRASPKIFRFRSDIANVAVLKAAGMSALCLANNHVLDCGREAMSNMLELLDSAGIAHSGAGLSLRGASQPAVSVVQGLKIGLLSFTDHEEGWQARPASAGVFYAPIESQDERTTALLNAVRSARENADFLVVAPHWGANWGSTPPPEHRALARNLIDAGADLVFGHSPHVCRGIEVYKQRPILYSTGAFIDDYAVSPTDRNDRSFLFFVELEDRRASSIRLVPSLIRKCQAWLAGGAEAEAAGMSMVTLCAALGTSAELDGGCCPRIPVN
jgi:poly-gamma-glutamate capsule biosynthesis protein CapA/YwtB (metallophosphatase superfamily)